MDDIYTKIDDYNLNKRCKVLLVFDDMIANKNLHAIFTELFVRGSKLNTLQFQKILGLTL